MQNKNSCRSHRSTKYAVFSTTSIAPDSAMIFATAFAIVLFVLISTPSRPAACAGSVKNIANVLLSDSIVTPVSDGVTFERKTALTSAGWVQMSVIRVDLATPNIAVGPVLADDVLTSPKTVTSIAETAGLVAAINGDFFDIGATSAPLSFLAADGRVLRSPRKDSDFASLVIRDDGTGLVGQWRWKGVLKGPNGLEITLAGLNEISVPADLAVLYNKHWSWERRPANTDVYHLVIRSGVVESFSKGWPTPTPSTSSNTENVAGGAPKYEFGHFSDIGSYTDANLETTPTRDDEAIYVVLRGHAAQVAQQLSPGDPVWIEATLTPPTSGILSAFSGKPVLVADGAVVPGLWAYTGIQSLFTAPRTAVGLTQDGSTLIMTVVDGRLPGARGVTLKELAQIMISLGAHEALNLDGGGSSTAAVRDPITGRVILGNRPSGGSQRRVPYAVGVWDTASQATEAAKDIDYIDADILDTQMPAFISVSVDSESSATDLEDFDRAASNDESERRHLGSFPSLEAAVKGGPTFLAGPEVSFSADSKVILTATIYDAAGRPLEPEHIPDNIEIVWEVTPPKNLRGIPLPGELWSVSEDSFSAVLFGDMPGRFEITVKAVEGEPTQDCEKGQHEGAHNESSILTQMHLAVRSVDQQNTIMTMMPTGDGSDAHAGARNDATGHLVLVEDFEGPLSWTGSVSSSLIGCSISTVDVDGSEAGFSASALSEASNLLLPSGIAVALEYDLRGPEQTRAAYVRPPHPSPLPAGTSAIQMWVYGDGDGHWLRATVRDWQGNEVPIDFPRIHWTGWRIVEASVPSKLDPPFHLSQVYVVEFKPELQSAGRIMIDNIVAVVSPNGPQRTEQDIDKITSSAPGRHIVKLDGARQPLPWSDILAEFDQFKADNDIELVVVLEGPDAVDIESLQIGRAFRDPLEAELLFELLKGLADGATSVVLVQDPPATGRLHHNMEAFIDGVQVIWRKSADKAVYKPAA